MSLIDTHCHIDLYESPEKVANESEEKKIYTIAVTNAPSVFFYTKKICEGKKFVRPALGFHPQLATQKAHELEMFAKLINETNYIGEIGLDGQDKSSDDFKIQVKIFGEILKLCAENGKKILTIHSRMASNEVISLIGKSYPGKIILHWYSGGMKDLDTALDYGFYFSVNYQMTTFNSGKKIIERIPVERILIETDGPFTEYNNQPATPILSREIVQRIQVIKNEGLDVKVTEDIIFDNFKRLLTS